MTKKQRKIFYPVIFFLGAILIIWEINIYRETIINLMIPIGIIMVVGIIAFILDFKNYSGIGLYLYSAMHYVIGFGFIACSIFMLSNYYFADQNTRTESYEIIRTSSLASGGKYRIDVKTPTFRINYNGKVKELVFSSEFYEKRKFYNNVELEIRQGLFGFDILENKKLN